LNKAYSSLQPATGYSGEGEINCFLFGTEKEGEMKYCCSTLLLVALIAQPTWAKLEVGQLPQRVELNAKLGGRIDGTPWSSHELKDKVHVLFYVDPDLKDLNNEASEALKAEKFHRADFQSVAIINMGATWLPKFVIKSSLKKKQNQYPDTIYIRDNQKTIVNAWGIDDENNNVLAFDKQGKLIFIKEGKLNSDDIKTLIAVINKHLDR
jgi:YtfJ family uncharacterized protein